MQDLTTGSITAHLLKNTSFMLVMMVFQTLYFLIDLYWVGRLGTTSVAAVGVGGNLSFIVLGITQMLGVGTTVVVSHAAGRKDQREARHLFNQALVLSVVTGVVFLAVALASLDAYATALSADAETARQARSYLLWFAPAMALQFPLVAMGSALRAVGNFKTGMVVGTATVILNMVLAPFLIFGWVTGRPFGVAGAAISSLVAIVVALFWFAAYFLPKSGYLCFSPRDWRPEPGRWRRMLAIGLPAGFEFAMIAVYLALVYALARPFGAAAQAGFGIGQRIIQAGFMPVVALGFGVAPVAGQNFGAQLADRVRATFKDAALLATVVMVAFALASQIAPAALIGVFSSDPAVIDVGVVYLRIISWNYVASGLVFVVSSMFQAMGNTMPSVIASGTRIALVAVPALILAQRPDFQLVWIWYLSMGAVWIQLALALLMLRREFRLRLAFGERSPVTPAVKPA